MRLSTLTGSLLWGPQPDSLCGVCSGCASRGSVESAGNGNRHPGQHDYNSRRQIRAAVGGSP